MQATRTVPIVFVNVPDPVGAGYVASLAKPGGNVTGFTPYDYTTSGKWLELLKQIAPAVMRAGVIRDTAEPAGIGQLTAIESVATSVGIKVIAIDARDAQDIERGIKALAADTNGGLIVLVGASPAIHRELIIAQSMQHQLPCVYPYRHFVTSGGLASYGPDLLDEYRRAAAYADRILRGEKPADLPVQAPTKYELVINLKTAKALGLTVPPSLVARADEVIE
jgi:putative ABC transport system substrate-binding protein